jgi:multidrug resistance efflux pump
MENLERQLAEAQLNRENAAINLENIALPAGGTELVQYTADVTASRQNIFTAENDIKSTEIKLALQQRKLDDARKMLENNTILHQNGVITQNEYDLAVTALASAEQAMADLNLQREANAQTLATRQAQLTDAEQKLANAQNKLSDKATANKHRQQQNAIALIQLQMDQIQSELSKIVAHSVSPIDGYITNVHIKSGEIASKGAALVEIADTAHMQVNVDLTEYDAPRMQIGQKAKITTSAIPNIAYEGAITKIAVGAVESAGSDDDDAFVPIEITILNLDEHLKPGYTVDVSVVTEEKENVLSVPIQAIVLEGVNRFVYLMHTQPVVRRVFWKTIEFEESTLTKVPVVTGLYGDKTVEIVSGIRAGDPVVTNASDVDLSEKPFFDWETLRKKLPWNKNDQLDTGI